MIGNRNRTAFKILNQLKEKKVPKEQASCVMKEWNQEGLPEREITSLLNQVYASAV